MRKLFKIVFFLTILGLTACGPTRFVEPLEEGERAIGIDYGGPIINVPGVATIPLPLSSITFGKGVSEKLTAYGSWFPTAAFFGTIQLDAGATYLLHENDKKNQGLSATPGANFAIDVFEWRPKIWPHLDVNYFWRYNKKDITQDDFLMGTRPTANILYAGLGSWFELSPTRAHNEPQETRILPMLNIGHDWNGSKWSFKSELKLIAPFTSNENIVVDYFSLTGNRGATGLYFGLIRKF